MNLFGNFLGTQANIKLGQKQAQDDEAKLQSDLAYKAALARQASASAAAQEYETSIAPQKFASAMAMDEAQIGQITANTSRLKTDNEVIRYDYMTKQANNVVTQYRNEVRNKTPEQQLAITKQYQPALDQIVTQYGGPKITLSPNDIKQPLTAEALKALIPTISAITRVAKSPNKDIRNGEIAKITGGDVTAGAMQIEQPKSVADVEKQVEEVLAAWNYESNPGIVKTIIAQMGVEKELYQEQAYTDGLKQITELKQTTGMPFKRENAKQFVDGVADAYYLKTKQKLPPGVVQAWTGILMADTPGSIQAAHDVASRKFEERKLDVQVKESAKDRAFTASENAKNRAADLQGRRISASGGGGSGGLTAGQLLNQQNKMYALTEKQIKEENEVLGKTGYYAGLGQIAGVSAGLNDLARVKIRNRGIAGTGADSIIYDVAGQISNAYSAGITPNPGQAPTVTGISKNSADKIRYKAVEKAFDSLPKNASKDYIKDYINTVDTETKNLFTGVNYAKPFPSLELVVKTIKARKMKAAPKSKGIGPSH